MSDGAEGRQGHALNRLVLSAQLAERGVMRYTPAGVPVLDVELRHESQVVEGGHPRQVSMSLRAKALGEIAHRLDGLPLGSAFDASGFLSPHRNGRGLVFHITDIA